MVKLDNNENHCLFDKKAPESVLYRYFTSYDYGCQVLAIFKFPNEYFGSGGLIESAEYRINQIKTIETSDEVQEKCNSMLDCIKSYEEYETTLDELKEKCNFMLDCIRSHEEYETTLDELKEKCNSMLDCIRKKHETILDELKEEIIQILSEFENVKVEK